MSELLKGKRALVTGGASGIGLAIGSAFVDAGATVVLADRNPVVATVASEIGSEGVVLDATSESAIVGVVSDMMRRGPMYFGVMTVPSSRVPPSR